MISDEDQLDISKIPYDQLFVSEKDQLVALKLQLAENDKFLDSLPDETTTEETNTTVSELVDKTTGKDGHSNRFSPLEDADEVLDDAFHSSQERVKLTPDQDPDSQDSFGTKVANIQGQCSGGDASKKAPAGDGVIKLGGLRR